VRPRATWRPTGASSRRALGSAGRRRSEGNRTDVRLPVGWKGPSLKRLIAIVSVWLVMATIPIASANGQPPDKKPNPAKTACQLAYDTFGKSGIGDPPSKDLRATVKAFDKKGVPKALKTEAKKLITSRDVSGDLVSLIVGCRRLGYLPP